MTEFWGDYSQPWELEKDSTMNELYFEFKRKESVCYVPLVLVILSVPVCVIWFNVAYLIFISLPILCLTIYYYDKFEKMYSKKRKYLDGEGRDYWKGIVHQKEAQKIKDETPQIVLNDKQYKKALL